MYENKYMIMSAGPTSVRENVREAMALECTNPDLDPGFYDYYRETCSMLSEAVGTENKAFILAGEGILGLEAACCTLTEPGDRVLVIDNGIFGRGFADFVTMYGGEAVLFTTDYKRPVRKETLREFLENDSDFKYATLVHMDTPTGVVNDIEALTGVLAEYGIMSVVDSVAGLFGEPLDAGKCSIDVLCGGSQKALSAPPGITMFWLSERAIEAMRGRKAPVSGFYTNMLTVIDYYETKHLPYTMPTADINGLRQALENFLADAGVFDRHERVARGTRTAIAEAGLELYLEEGFSRNVTVFNVPSGITADEILDEMRDDHGIMLSGGLAEMKGKVIRIGHMGENANEEDVAKTLAALQQVLEGHGITVRADMKSVFLDEARTR